MGSNEKFAEPDSTEKLLPWFESTKPVKSISSRKSRISQPNTVKDSRSILLSVFNMMNLIVGGGVIGLPYAASNTGYIGFMYAIVVVLIIAMTTQYFTISAAEKLEQIDPDIIPGYEELGYRASGNKRWGKIAVSAIVMFHTFTCCCTYTFVIKKEAGPIAARMWNLFQENETSRIDLEGFRTTLPPHLWYLDEKFTLGIFMLFIILPLSCLRSVRHLGWTSMMAMFSVAFFVATVVSKQEEAAGQCPIKYDDEHKMATKQICKRYAFTYNAETIYSLPTLLFSFECHGTMLPIYCDLRLKTKSKMLKIIATALSFVAIIYTLTAVYGYFSFYNHTASEFLTAFEYLKFEDLATNFQIMFAKFMMLIVVTFSAPLFCFVFRKSVFLNAFPHEDPEDASHLKHYGFTVLTMATVYIIVISVTDLKVFFALGGQISATSLMIIFPSVFYVFIVHAQKKFQLKTIVAWFLIIFGTLNMTFGSINIIQQELTGKEPAENYNTTTQTMNTFPESVSSTNILSTTTGPI